MVVVVDPLQAFSMRTTLRRPCSSSRFGATMVSTPFLKAALTFSGTMPDGSGMMR
jgi:hypothetical protein